jgi:hypothetical protein
MNKVAKCVSCNKYDNRLKKNIIDALIPIVEKNIINYIPLCKTHISELHSGIPIHMICEKCMQKYHEMVCQFDTNIMNCPVYNCNRQIYI